MVGVTVGGPDDAEVAPVDRGDRGCLMAFSNGHDAGVDKTEVVVVVGRQQFTGALVVDEFKVDETELAASNSGDERGLGGIAELSGDEPRGLYDHWGRHDHLAAVFTQQLRRSPVPAIRPVGDGDQDASVNDDHDIGSGRVAQVLAQDLFMVFSEVDAAFTDPDEGQLGHRGGITFGPGGEGLDDGTLDANPA